MGRNFTNSAVRRRVASYPKAAREKLLALRAVILDVAKSTEGVGRLEEALKWNEPSFLTSQTKSGSTVRIDWKEKDPDYVHVYFKCTSRLLEIFRYKFPNHFTFVGDREIRFGLREKIPTAQFKQCIAIALTYHSGNFKNYRRKK